MATLPPADAPASGRSLRTRRTDTGADREADGQFAVTLGPDGPIDPHAATLRPSDHIDPYAETLSPSRKSAALADTMAPEDPATGSTLGPESAASLREHSLDGVVSVGDMSRLHSEYPVVRWDRYEFQKKLGQGGMGAVYKARDRRLGRDVALKFIRGGDPNMVMRFLQEARAQARIDHPHVCKVYEVGEVEGKAYIAMQYVDGHSLNRAAKDLSLTEKVLLMRQVAEAMHEAHRLGIIHRDLKPDNIMVERLTDGTLSPVVMDFGLARESGDNRGLTESGAVMGTPAYMAPEQARGDVRTLDRRADVYSLGATLYDLVAGSPPFDAESIVDVLMQVMNEDAVPLRNRLPSVPSDLETIVMKCLRKEPGARYDSAKALADDLQRYIDG
ncbi:MAG TPA: serine/threonine-protein kinase, partial [Pseudomonadota bacterium]|nr:serine/threonine-protein kinase [Pseudomonadota bacterium]